MFHQVEHINKNIRAGGEGYNVFFTRKNINSKTITVLNIEHVLLATTNWKGLLLFSNFKCDRYQFSPWGSPIFSMIAEYFLYCLTSSIPLPNQTIQIGSYTMKLNSTQHVLNQDAFHSSFPLLLPSIFIAFSIHPTCVTRFTCPSCQCK